MWKLNVNTLCVCCISKFEPYMLCCCSSVITHFNMHMSCILTQVVGLLAIWVQWTHQRAKWMDDGKTYYQASCRGDKPTGTKKPANANPESSRVFFMKLTSCKIQKEVSFNRIANLNTKDIRWHSRAVEKGNQGMRFLECQTKWFRNWTQEETSANLSKCHIKVQKLCKRKSQNIKMDPLLKKSRGMMKRKNGSWPYSHNQLAIIDCAKLIYGKSIMANWL